VSISAILVVGQQDVAGIKSASPAALNAVEKFSTEPVACHEILGESTLQRTVKNLRRAGVGHISAIIPRDVNWHPDAATISVSGADNKGLWHAAERKVQEVAQAGAELILLIRLGAYVEFDLGDLLSFHQAKGRALSGTRDNQGHLDFWVINSAEARSFGTHDIGKLIGGRGGISPVPHYLVRGYVNRLASMRDLRQLVEDSFSYRCSIRPQGKEVRPGVWLADGAKLHRSARLVAPVYMGAGTKVRAGSAVTRSSSVERGCDIGYGTVVEDSSILSNTCVGSGLEVSHAVVDGNHLMNFDRDVAVELYDRKLITRSARLAEAAYWPLFQPA
jgi:hypothetical protein